MKPGASESPSGFDYDVGGSCIQSPKFDNAIADKPNVLNPRGRTAAVNNGSTPDER